MEQACEAHQRWKKSPIAWLCSYCFLIAVGTAPRLTPKRATMPT